MILKPFCKNPSKAVNTWIKFALKSLFIILDKMLNDLLQRRKFHIISILQN